MKPLHRLGSLQKQVLETVWALPGSTVRTVAATIDPAGKLAYTTVLSTLQKLEADGWLTHARQGRAHVYQATRSREEAHRMALRDFIHTAYGGSIGALLRDLWSESANPPRNLRSLVEARRAVA